VLHTADGLIAAWNPDSMYEWHGWATIRDTATVADVEENPSRLVLSRVRTLLAEQAAVANETADLSVANGEHHLWLAGSHNHLAPGIVGLYRAIAAVAPGSYGILCTHDDDVSNCWDRWVMRRGQVCQQPDHDLSPHVGLVEDNERP
jgi:Immunity protein 7